MSLDVLDSLNSVFGSPLLRQLGPSLGESETTTRSAVRAVGPTVLAGVIGKAFSGGSADVLRAFNDERVDPGIVAKLGSLVGNSGNLANLRAVGESLASTIFGQRSNGVTAAFSEVTGVRAGTASSLLTIALPVVLGILKKYTANRPLDTHSLGTLLASQKASLQRSGLDDRITNALGFPSLASVLNLIPKTQTTEPARTQRASWVRWAVAAGVGALALLTLMNVNRGGRDASQPLVTNQPANTTQVFFGSGETNVDDGDRIKIASVAQSAKSQDRNVTITGYTDRTGDEDQNIEVAKDRAAAVRDALVEQGVAEDRIRMEPPAAVTGSGSDDEARRVDIKMR